MAGVYLSQLKANGLIIAFTRSIKGVHRAMLLPACDIMPHAARDEDCVG